MKTAEENPNGLHQKYVIEKTDGTPVDPNAEYFILRVDGHQKDKAHMTACLKALSIYAEAIKGHIPQLSEDLIERYNLSQFTPSPKEISEEEIYAEADKYRDQLSDIFFKPDMKEKMWDAYVSGAHWMRDCLSHPSSSSKTEAVEEMEKLIHSVFDDWDYDGVLSFRTLQKLKEVRQKLVEK